MPLEYISAVTGNDIPYANSFQRSVAKSYTEQLLPFAIFAISVAYLFIFRHFSSLEPDEGIILRGAERILNGEVPYRDFFSFYTPGCYYLLAAVFRIFGDSFVVARISLAVAGGLCSMITFLMSRRFCPLGVSAFVAALTTIAGLPYRFLVLHNWYSTVLCCTAIYAAFRLLESQSLAWGFAVGSLSSVAILFEQSKGAGLCFGIALGFLLIGWLHGEWLKPHLLIFATLGFTLPFLLTFAYFGDKHAIVPMVQSWLWPLAHYATANHVPYGYQNWTPEAQHEILHSGSFLMRAIKVVIVSPGFIVPALPLVAVAFLVYWCVRALRTRGEPSSGIAQHYLLVCAVCLGLFLSIIVSRADVIHFMYLAPLWYVVLAWLLGAQQSKKRRTLAARQCLFAYVAIAFGLMGFAMLLQVAGARFHVHTRRGVISSSHADIVIDYVQSHVAPGQNLLIYPYLPLYNYLTDTNSPAPLDYFQPGMNTEEQAIQIIEALKTKPDQVVLYESNFIQKITNAWPRTPRSAVALDPVANYIAQEYRTCALLNSPEGWTFEFRVRKEAGCP